MKSCMWAAAHMHDDQNQIQRAVGNMNVEQIQQKFITTEHQIADLLFGELAGLYGQFSWAESLWRSCTLLHKDIYKQFTAKVSVLADSVLRLGGKCPQYRESARFGEQDRISNFISTPEYRELDNPLCSSGRFSQSRLQSSFSKRSKSWWRLSSRVSRRPSKTASYVCQCTTTLTGPLRIMQLFAKKKHLKALSTPRTFFGLGDEENGTECSPTNPKEYQESSSLNSGVFSV